MTREQRLAEIKGRLKAATPGPWSIEEHGTGETLFSYVNGEQFHPLNLISFDDPDARWPRNKALIANAPTDIEWLVAELERALRVVESVRLADSGKLNAELGEPVQHIRRAMAEYDAGGSK